MKLTQKQTAALAGLLAALAVCLQTCGDLQPAPAAPTIAPEVAQPIIDGAADTDTDAQAVAS